jgi:DNA-binding GntR family transcriptional regulator
VPNPDTDPVSTAPGLDVPVEEVPRLRQQVYERIRRAIINGQFAPGERLSVSRIAESLQVSTMPVREAIRLLEEDGLVETSARRWTRVATVSAAQAEELYPLVGLLEEYAVATGSQATPAYLRQLREANRALVHAESGGDAMTSINADERFHAILLEGCSNQALLQTVAQFKTRMRLHESVFFRHGAHGSTSQHEEIVAAIERGDRQRAGGLVRAHWASGLEALRQESSWPGRG